MSKDVAGERVWQILDVGSVWMKEFAAALTGYVSTVAWAPQMVKWGLLRNWRRSERILEPPLDIERFPLQTGYARAPISWLLPFAGKVLSQLRSQCDDPSRSPLICTTPYYAPVAERWPGPAIYYATDLTFAYEGLDSAQINGLDRRLCRAAKAVCPNSRRIAQYFIDQAGCDPAKITVVPNATRRSNIANQPLLQPGLAPEDIRDLPRPYVGVIGNLSANMDWKLLMEVVRETPRLTWVFVGPTSMPIRDREQSSARDWVSQHARFVGNKPYGELQVYARALDVAVLPYRKKEPTYSGSSTRFYEHLAACRPMVATRGFAELLEKPPLVRLVDSPAEMREALADLSEMNFSDGLETDRWNASKSGTWDERARSILATV